MSANPEWLARGTSEIFPDNPDDNLAKAIAEIDRPLRVKLGIDPTGSDLHLGHSIPFRKLRDFQDAGHTAVVIIGDFTAQIGDPTGKSDVRKQLTAEQVKENAQTYLEQLRPILDFDTPGRLEIRYNSEWLKDLDLAKTQELLATMTVQQMLAKEGFAKRYDSENPIYIHEFLYPLMQGYDSVMVEADVELGGTDQKFNVAVGRDLLRYFGKKPQFGLLLPILVGTDGKEKMSKSLNNYVGLKDNHHTMYQKLQNTLDTLLPDYFELLTKIDLGTLPENPREQQKLLAREIVTQFHGADAATDAEKAVQNVAAANIPEFSLVEIEFPSPLFYILGASGLCSSSGDGRRQIKGGAVRLDDERMTDINTKFESAEQLIDKVLRVGKKKFIRLIP
ncbi:tyrosyl-tRNA synthetase [[Leptolyngbya] sp. PCC 7376]|uniref:tyrosine--tRNA ligase n=1 Tax=[Leptolyngbya] sp. PCC 7376 TaxID=111781 RepID=UPI00029F1DDD|nr:tyrosine--tRNA ligase [[Leptolyngbya] sp. PCC 7376]AFY39224.1 tyrosyl-tRNA synthetase [[Leptolyngbya] sp. PCC 7376]